MTHLKILQKTDIKKFKTLKRNINTFYSINQKLTNKKIYKVQHYQHQFDAI